MLDCERLEMLLRMIVPVVRKFVKRVFVGTGNGCIGADRGQAAEGAKVFITRGSGLAFALEVLRVGDIKWSIT